MAKILILGGGFAGVTAAEMVASALSDEHEITVVSLNHSFTFYPALVPLVFGDFKPEEIHFDMVPKLLDARIRFIQGELISIHVERKTVRINGDDIDGEIHYDFLLIAIGRRLATEKVPGFFEYAHHLLGVGAALKFKKAISDFKAGSIVVGLCPGAALPIPVCETALALAEQFERQIADGDVSISAVFPRSMESAFAGAALFRDLEGAFAQKGIKLIADFPIESVEPGRIFSSLATPIDYDLLMLIPPFRGQAPLLQFARTDDKGFARVNSRMQVEGVRNIYAAGDIVSLPGPRFGYMAMRQAKVAAVNILAEVSGEEPHVEYAHEIEWIIGEKYTHPVFFHYGFWDDTLKDFDEDALFGMAKLIRERYGAVKPADGDKTLEAYRTQEQK